ncbi:MAG: hypothetical protein HY804_13520 [Nitrospinae bacterium]|nr:hypothetical protein [Nitrospinota bacterium]
MNETNKPPVWWETAYAHHDPGPQVFRIGQSMRLIGLVSALFLAPVFALVFFAPEGVFPFPRWAAYPFLLLIGATGFVATGFARRAEFDRARGTFTFRYSLFKTLKKVEGAFSDVQYVELKGAGNLDAPVRDAKGRPPAVLSFYAKGESLDLAMSGPGTALDEARALSVFIGCPLRVTGNTKQWGIEKRKGLYVESVEKARAALEG